MPDHATWSPVSHCSSKIASGYTPSAQPKYQVCRVRYWWLLAPVVGDAESRLTTRIYLRRRIAMACPASLTDYSTSLIHLCSYTTGIRRVGKLRLLTTPVLRVPSAFDTPARTPAGDYTHDPSCKTNPAPPANKQTATPPAPRSPWSGTIPLTLSPSVKCKSKLSTISATWRLSDAVA